jgi:hypothetical protein
LVQDADRHSSGFLIHGFESSLQQASLEVALGQAQVPQAWKASYGSAFSGDSSGAVVLGKLLRLSFPMMSEFGAPIYPSESKLVLKFSWRRKDAQLNEILIV